MIVQYGPWEPDGAGVDVPVLSTAKNVWPSKQGYIPIQVLLALSSAALPAKCVGACVVRSSSGGWTVYAGTQTKLYKYSASAWVDVTRASGGSYGVPADDYWSFTQYGTQLIAVNLTDDPQVIDVDSGTNFAALGGTPPRARYVSTVGDFVVLAALSSSDRKLRNSAINDATGWTVGTSLCDEQEFPDGGRITGIRGGEYGYVGQELSIRRMIFQPGSDQAFRFERVDEEHGPAAGYSLVGNANNIAFLANDGFYLFGPGGLTPIGAGRVNKWFRANSDLSRYFAVQAISDPFAPRWAWAFYNSVGSTNFDRLLFYDWSLDRWSYAEIEAQFWASLVTPGVTLEDLDVYGDIDSGGIPYPFDSRVWQGGAPVIGAINPDGELAFLEGSLPHDATLLTAPMHVNSGQRSKSFNIEPMGIFNGASPSLRIGKRESTQNAVVYTSAITPSSLSGIMRGIASGRIHEFELSVTQTSGTIWTHVQGLDVQMATGAGRK